MPVLREFLLDETKHPYLKTSIIYILVENKVEEEIEVEKFGDKITVIPTHLHRNEEFTNQVLHTLSARIESENPTMFETIVTYWEKCKQVFFRFRY